jgi:nitroreductase
MSLSEILTTRYSVRGFLDKTIDELLLQQIFKQARLASSNCNVQPWQPYVVSGKTKDQLKKALVNEVMNGAVPSPEFDWIPKYRSFHRERQFGAANALYSAMNISREDKKARQMAMLRNWQFFDAPHVVFFCMQKYLGIMGAVDLGIYAQTLSLLLQENRISSCMQGALGQFPRPIKQILNIPDDTGVLFGMSFGYEDPQAPANQARTDRASFEQQTTFIE